MIRAIDVSVHQGSIDWRQVEVSGVQGAWIKVGGADAGQYRDPNGDRNLDGATAVGLAHGTYWFAYPFVGNAIRQAQYAVSTGLGRGELPPALDFERPNGLSWAAMDEWVLTFVGEVERSTGRKCIIYTGAWIGTSATGYFGRTAELADYHLWIANYGNNQPGTTPPNFDPPVPEAWARKGWSMWQFNSRTMVPGIPGNVTDQNIVKDGAWVDMLTATPIFPEGWRMKRILIQGEAQQYRLVDDAFGCLRRQPIDSMELVHILEDADVTDGEITLTDPATIDRFRKIPVIPGSVAEWGIIDIVAKGVEQVKTTIGQPLDAVAVADGIAKHLSEHLGE